MDVAMVPPELPENPGGSPVGPRWVPGRARVGPGWVPTKSKDREIAHPNLIKITPIFGSISERFLDCFWLPFDINR